MRYLSQDFKIFHNADKLAERIFLLFSFLFVGLIVFPSSLLSVPQAHKHKSSLTSQLLRSPSITDVYAHHDLGDLSTNVLFYIPFGLFLSLTVSFRKPRFFTPWLAAGFILSVSMESAQYFVNRSPDPVDVMTNSLGFIVGFELGVFAIKFFGLRPSAILGINPDKQNSTKINTIASIRFIYMAVYLLCSWLPFDMIFHWKAILEKQHPDKWGHIRLILNPFYHFSHWRFDASALLGSLWGLLPLAVLTGVLQGFRKKFDLARIILVCALLVVISEIGQLFVYSRTTDVFMIVLAVLAGFLGWCVSLLWFRLQDTHGYSSFENEKHRNDFIFFVTFIYASLLVLAALVPFRFEYSFKAVIQKLLYQTNWVLFHNQVGLRDMEMSFGLLRDAGAFVPLGLLITFCWKVAQPTYSRTLLMSLTIMSAVVFSFVLEIIKAASVGQYADVTFLLFAFAGAVIGSISFHFFTRTSDHL